MVAPSGCAIFTDCCNECISANAFAKNCINAALFRGRDKAFYKALSILPNKGDRDEFGLVGGIAYVGRELYKGTWRDDVAVRRGRNLSKTVYKL